VPVSHASGDEGGRVMRQEPDAPDGSSFGILWNGKDVKETLRKPNCRH
jgi:hypothetical protein